MEQLLYLQVCLKWVERTIQKTKKCIIGKENIASLNKWKRLHYLIIKLKINIFLAEKVQCNKDQCVLYYTRNKTLPLWTSLCKRYCSEVHLLNQHLLHNGHAVPRPPQRCFRVNSKIVLKLVETNFLSIPYILVIIPLRGTIILWYHNNKQQVISETPHSIRSMTSCINSSLC